MATINCTVAKSQFQLPDTNSQRVTDSDNAISH